MHTINVAFVFGMRLIGKGHSAAKKLCSAVNINTLSQTAYRGVEIKLGNAAKNIADEAMNEAAFEIKNEKNINNVFQCGMSVDGSWQRRGYSSLNGCVTAISVDSGKVLDIEVMSKVCRACKNVNDDSEKQSHNCSKHTGSSNAMEPVGAYRIFERSPQLRQLQYVAFYGDGDSKAYDTVKHVYGKDSVKKYECIGHIQKRVGSGLRKLKTKQKGLGGRGKLTDHFIDKLQSYYGIAIRSNINDLENMQRAVIAALFHCSSGVDQPMHGQCPDGRDSWCKSKRAAATGKNFQEKSKGLPKNILNIIKPLYMKLCDQKLLKKCLHGKTQNANESFNGVLWQYVPKDIFVEEQTLKLGAYLAVIQFNNGYKGLLNVLNSVGIHPGVETVKGFSCLDAKRISQAKRQSLTNIKKARKKNRLVKKMKMAKYELKEGTTYKCGEF